MAERPDWSTFWADLRRDYASLGTEIREGFGQAREQWRELIAVIRQDKQFHRRMMQRATGLENPTRRDWRKASKAFMAEAREIEETERRVLREHDEDGR